MEAIPGITHVGARRPIHHPPIDRPDERVSIAAGLAALRRVSEIVEHSRLVAGDWMIERSEAARRQDGYPEIGRVEAPGHDRTNRLPEVLRRQRARLADMLDAPDVPRQTVSRSTLASLVSTRQSGGRGGWSDEQLVATLAAVLA